MNLFKSARTAFVASGVLLFLSSSFCLAGMPSVEVVSNSVKKYVNNVENESNFFGGDELKVKFTFNCTTDSEDTALVCWRVTWRDASGATVKQDTTYISNVQPVDTSTDYNNRTATYTAASIPSSQYTATIEVGTYSIIDGSSIPSWQDSYQGGEFTYE